MAILPAEKETQTMAEYDKWVSAALMRPPTDPKKDPAFLEKKLDEKMALQAAYEKQLEDYSKNPLKDIVPAIKKEFVDLGYEFDETKGEFKDVEVQKKFKEALDKPRAAFKKGLEEGPAKQIDFSTVMNDLSRFDIFSALKDAIMALPIVGDVMGTSGVMLQSLFTKKKFIGPIDAFNELRADRALTGGLEQLGINNADEVKRISDMVVSGTGLPAVTQTPSGKEPKKEEPKKEEPKKEEPKKEEPKKEEPKKEEPKKEEPKKEEPKKEEPKKTAAANPPAPAAPSSLVADAGSVLRVFGVEIGKPLKDAGNEISTVASSMAADIWVKIKESATTTPPSGNAPTTPASKDADSRTQKPER